MDEESKFSQKFSSENFQVHKKSARKRHKEAHRPKSVDKPEGNGRIFQAVFEQAPIGLAQISLDGTFLRVNRRLEEILGYDRHGLSGLSLTQVIFSEDSALILEPESEAVERRFVRQDGSLMWARVSTALVDADGQPGFIIAVVEDLAERRQREEEIKARLRDKEAQIQEIHHRVKNNMQVLSSLLNLYRMKIKDGRIGEAIRECQDRITAMALVHEVLYQSGDQSRVDLKEYIGRLAQGVWTSYGEQGRVGLSLELEPINLDIDQAVPLGLALNELLSNSLKHAFPDGRTGQVRIQAGQPAPGLIEIVVEDDGVGLGPDVDWRNAESLGLKLSVGLVERQLGGRVDLEGGRGTRFIIRFKAAESRGEFQP